jgi:aminomethyltransferase
MIRHTPFHPRTSAVSESGLWSHWAGYLAADRYLMSDKFEYFAIRNSAGIFDTSPLYKYRITGPDAERYLAGVLIRDIRRCQPGQAHYTAWVDDAGWLLEDGVILRFSGDEFLLTTAQPNLSYFEGLATHQSVVIEDVSEHYGALAVQGPRSREILSLLAPEIEDLRYFHVTQAKLGDASVIVSRTGFTGDLGYEIWVEADDALEVWDRLLEVATPRGGIPIGQTALLIARIEAGLLLIHVDFDSARFAWNDDQRATPVELGMGWMLGDLARDERAFIGRRALEAEIEGKTSRWKTTGIMVDWEHWARVHNERGLITPKDHTPVHGGMMLYDDDLERIGYVPSFVYSPVLQRHIGIARIRPEHAAVGTRVGLEVTIDHRYEVVDSTVTRMPFYDPARRAA